MGPDEFQNGPVGLKSDREQADDMAGTPWSRLGPHLNRFLDDGSDPLIGSWAVGQGIDAPDRQLFRHLVRSLARHNHVSVLEVGCGSGIELRGMIHDGLTDLIDYVGLDFTPELIEVCRKRYGDFHFELADMLTMDEPERADVVLARCVLEHVEDGEHGLRNLFKASRLLVVVSWFMRPTWDRTKLGITMSEGFVHRQYGIQELSSFIRQELAPSSVTRLDFDHYSYPWSVWLIWKRSPPRDVLDEVNDFVSSERFINSVLPPPPCVDSQERVRWLEEQRANWEREAATSRTLVEEQQAYIREFTEVKNWLEEQRANWEHEAGKLRAIVEAGGTAAEWP